MSISPTDANSPASFTSSISLSANTSSNHGSPREPRLSPDLHPVGSPVRMVEIGGSEDLDRFHPGSPDSVVAFAGGSCVMSHNVAELSTQDQAKGSEDQESGVYVQDLSTSIGGITSRTRSYQSRYTRHNGKVPGVANSLHSHQSSAGSRSPHGNATQGARKNQMVNGNHLLNFHYDPIQRSQPRMPPPRRQQKVRPFNRDLFLQANYKFVVLDTGEYVVESMDPDKMLQWDDIVCVRYSTPSPVQCPICLESPLCPQITSCGHIFCFPCILRYLLMGEENHKGECWKKCPLCFMMISLKDLYTIFIDHVKQYDVGDQACFTLLTRPKGSFVPAQKNVSGTDLTSDSNELIDAFSKFTLTSDVEMSVREARLKLDEWLAKAESGVVDDLERLPYVCAALEQLEQRMNGWAEHQSVSSSSIKSHVNQKIPLQSTKIPPEISLSAKGDSADSKTCEKPTGTQSSGLKHEPVPYGLTSEGISVQSSMTTSDSISEPCGSPENKLSLDNEAKVQIPSSGCKDLGDKDEYVFYQVIDGQHLILHPLNMKCLLYHYKSYDLLPPRITGKILQLETVTQSEAIRRRFRFLSHFSLTTSFQLCEIDLSDLLPPDALSPFLDDIKKREKQRKQLARKEQEAKSRLEAAVPYAMPIPNHRQTSNNDATFTLDEFEALGTSIAPSTSPPVTGEKKLFSDVTRLGFAAAHDSPSLRVGESDFLSSVEGGVSSSVSGPSTPTLSFASIISSARTAGGPDGPKINGPEKKGKKTGRVLLSTAGGRRY